MSKKLITVFGATGMQGGSVVNALLADGTFAVRAITRKPTEAKAQDLSKRGVEVVQGDIAGPIEGLVEALKGSYGVFLLTNFWDPSQMANEKESGIKMVDAAHKAGVKHAVWSTLENVHRVSKGKWDVPHFTGKAEVEDYIRGLQAKSPKAFEHVTFVAPATYFQAFDTFFAPKQEGDTWVFTMPKTKLITGFDVSEIGPSVVASLKNPKKYDLKRIDYYGTNAHPEEYVKTYEKVTGRKTRLNAVPLDVFATLGFPGAKEIAHTFGWFDDFTYYGPNGDPKSGQEATPGGLSSFETYLRRTVKV